MLINSKKVSVSYFVASSHFPSKCGKNKTSKGNQYSTQVPKPFEVILTSHSFRHLVEYWFAKENGKRVFKNPPVKVKPLIASRVGYIVQLVLNAWNSMARRIRMVKCSMLIAPYILFNETTCQFHPLKSRSDGYALLSQSKSLKGTVGVFGRKWL